MTLLYCPANKPDGSPKDSLRNSAPLGQGLFGLPAVGTGSFVVNIVSKSFAERMAVCAEPLEHGDSEFALSGLTPGACARVRARRVLESFVSFECVTKQIVRTNGDAPMGGNIVIGEVVHIWAKDEVMNARGHIDPGMLDAVGRMGGLSYCTTRERFELPMGASRGS
jgi:flavin reductase (DIM6/NTAB) family NADH-FMN oxidoreductase RutF